MKFIKLHPITWSNLTKSYVLDSKAETYINTNHIVYARYREDVQAVMIQDSVGERVTDLGYPGTWLQFLEEVK